LVEALVPLGVRKEQGGTSGETHIEEVDEQLLAMAVAKVDPQAVTLPEPRIVVQPTPGAEPGAIEFDLEADAVGTALGLFEEGEPNGW
jgi:hypothetical protein